MKSSGSLLRQKFTTESVGYIRKLWGQLPAGKHPVKERGDVLINTPFIFKIRIIACILGNLETLEYFLPLWNVEILHKGVENIGQTNLLLSRE